jgi:hypothetical protein
MPLKSKIMKKVTYLLLLMFAVMLISISCEEDETLSKDDEISVDYIITPAELIGTWNSVSYEYQGEIYYDCNMLPSSCALEDWVVSSTTLDRYSHCGDLAFTWTYDIPYTLEVNDNNENIINYDSWTEYKILSYDKSTKELRIMLKYSASNYMKVGGIKTFQKQ